jgi:N4-gp56 family major capsid protein
MANTNFAALTNEQYTVWSRDFWKQARNKTFIMTFAGTSENAMVHRITELKSTKDGARAVITMVNDATGDGVVGDNQLKGNEEALRSTEDVITCDQWRHAHATEGEMSEQKSIVSFREQARDKLAYRASNILDQLAFLTLSGVAYTFNTNGSTRTGSQLPQLEFAADVSAPTSARYCRWDQGTNTLITSSASNADLVAADIPTWQMLSDLKAYAVEQFIRPMRSEDGIEVYNVFMSPRGIAKLKRDPDFLAAWQNAQKRGDENPLFKGTPHGGKKGIYVDGLNILEYRHVFNTLGATSGSGKWGAGSDVDGQRVLLCGAQALGFADIETAKWREEKDDYENRYGIGIAKKFGMLKPVLFSTYANSEQDFGVVACDTAI